MRLKDARTAFVDHLRRPGAVRTFVDAGRRRVVLALYEGPLEAIEELLGLQRALGLEWGRGADALLRAIVDEYQTSTSDVWPAMLIVIFYPVLTGLKRRAKTRFDREDLDGAAVASLLGGARALRNVATVDRLPMLIEQETRRRLWQVLGADLRDAALLRDLVPEAQARGRIEPFRGGRSEEQAHAVEALVLDDMIQEVVDAVPEPSALFGGEARGLRDLTNALHPGLGDADRDRFYQRVRKRLMRLRDRDGTLTTGALARALYGTPDNGTGSKERRQEP